MTISYVITFDIGINSIHKFIYPDRKNANIVCAMSFCINELHSLYVKMENY